MIKIPSKIEIKKSSGRGLGVFASEKIFKDEVFEVCPLIDLDINETSDILFDYRFYCSKNNENKIYVIALGYGSLYNHSNQNNADWRTGEHMEFEFFALTDIEKGEEIFIYYGSHEYFNLRKTEWV